MKGKNIMTLSESKKYANYICSIGNILNHFDRLYPFTTENISGYFKEKDIKNKNILTVGSSGDQAINAFVMGAKDVTIFDVNPFTKYFFDLKKAAIINLDLDEFLRFFCYYHFPKTFYKNPTPLDNSLFSKISKDLDSVSLEFWNYLFNIFKSKHIRQRLFIDDEYSYRIVSMFNNYLNEKNYYFLKEVIKDFNPTFIESDLLSIPSKLSKQYDTIYLSNISHYLKDYHFSLYLFRDNLLKLKQFMSDNSVMYFAYLYDMNETTKAHYYWDHIYHLDYVKKVFENEKIIFESFKGVKGIIHDEEKFKDSVLSLKK